MLAEHPDLTLTGLYNVLESLRAGGRRCLDADEDAPARGRVLILKELHDRLDARWPRPMAGPPTWPTRRSWRASWRSTPSGPPRRRRGHVRWLRPDYQIPRFAQGAPRPRPASWTLGDMVVAIDKGLPAFPIDRYEQPLAVEALVAAAGPMDAADIARGFKRGGKRIEERIAQVLATLALYGHVDACPGWAVRGAAGGLRGHVQTIS